MSQLYVACPLQNLVRRPRFGAALSPRMSSPGRSGFKAYRLYPVGTGLTPKVIKQAFSTTVAGLVGLNRPAVNALSTLL
jgi:hypothetical protein